VNCKLGISFLASSIHPIQSNHGQTPAEICFGLSGSRPLEIFLRRDGNKFALDRVDENFLISHLAHTASLIFTRRLLIGKSCSEAASASGSSSFFSSLFSSPSFPVLAVKAAQPCLAALSRGQNTPVRAIRPLLYGWSAFFPCHQLEFEVSSTHSKKKHM
jgi:hypothetical protein